MRAGIIATLLFLGTVTSSWAELHFTETKGLSKLIQLADRCSYLKAIHPVLERYQSRYINIFNYAPGEGSAAADPSEVLVQGLFSVPPGTDNPLFLRTSPLSRKFGRFLSPTTIGKILGVIESSDSIDPGALRQTLKNTISTDDDFKFLTEKSKEIAKAILVHRDALAVAQVIKGIKAEIGEKKTELNTLQSEMKGIPCNEARFSQIQDLKSDIATVAQKVANVKKQSDLKKEIAELEKEDKRLSETEEYKKLTDQYNSHRYDPSFMGEFLDRLVKSLQSERSPSQGGRYPKYFTEQVLLTLALLNTPDHDKGYFLKLYSELPEHCFKGDKKPNLSGPLMSERYTQMDYTKVKVLPNTDPEHEQAVHLIQNPDHAALLRYGKRFFDLEDVPILPYKAVSLMHSSKGQKFFPDCMEASILNFFSIIGKDSETRLLSGTSLQTALNDKGYRLHKEVESFFNTYQDPASLDTLRAHEEWAALMSFLDGVHYKNGDYEVKSEIDNIFAIMEKLIQPNHVGTPPLFEGLPTRKEKMDKLCKILSHKELDLSWDVEVGSKGDLDKNNHAWLRFSVGNNLSFTWRVDSGHSQMNAANPMAESWEEELSKSLSKLLTAQDRTSLDYKLRALFASSAEVPELAQKLDIKAGSKEYTFLQQGFTLSTVHEKLELASTMIGRDPHDVDWIKRLIGSIPRTDVSAQSLVMNFIITRGLDKVETFQKEFENAAQILKSEPENAVRYSLNNLLVGTLRYLASHRFPFDFYDDMEENPLHLLVQRRLKDIEPIQIIATSYPELLEQKNLRGTTPLQEAVRVGNIPTVMALLDKMQSRNIDINTKGIHTLSYAIKLGDIEMVKALADKEKITFRQAIEGFVNSPSFKMPWKRMNALSVIINEKKINFLKYLFINERELFIELLSNEDQDSKSPLQQLAKVMEGNSQSDTRFTEDLSKKLPEIFSVKEPRNGTTLLHLITERKQAKTVKLILKYLGTKVSDDLFLDHQGASPLHQAAASAGFMPAIEEITTALVKANPNWLKVKDKDGKTPLDLAKTPEMIQLLKKLTGE